MKKTILWLLGLFIVESTLLCCSALSVSAARSLSIDHVTINADKGKISIEGENFGPKTPRVELGDFTLKILNFSSGKIEAKLPSAKLSGTYRLTVFENKSCSTCSTCTISIAFDGSVYKRTIIVNPVAQNPSASGAILLNELGKIEDASSGNTYLLKLEPGVYDVGSVMLRMKPYVDIEGSGETTTKITSSSASSGALVEGADNAEIRFLTLENTGGQSHTVALLNQGASPRLTHVTVNASGASENTGVSNIAASPVIKDTTIMAKNGQTKNVGMLNAGGSGIVLIENSKISGSTKSIENLTGYTVNAVNTQLDGKVDNSGNGVFHCVSSYDAGYAVLPANCGALSNCVDNDGDGYFTQTGCGTEVDCNDNNASVHPGAPEQCNGIDDNCDGVIDEAGAINCVNYYRDADRDGYGDNNSVVCACTAPEGYVTRGGDCADGMPGIHPGAQEICWDYIDNNCDGRVDEECSPCGNGICDMGEDSQSCPQDCPAS